MGFVPAAARDRRIAVEYIPMAARDRRMALGREAAATRNRQVTLGHKPMTTWHRRAASGPCTAPARSQRAVQNRRAAQSRVAADAAAEEEKGIARVSGGGDGQCFGVACLTRRWCTWHGWRQGRHGGGVIAPLVRAVLAVRRRPWQPRLPSVQWAEGYACRGASGATRMARCGKSPCRRDPRRGAWLGFNAARRFV
ncbi:hypothetical protein E2562_003131 [Oryza meyeriana var. granulata]|uniref:Uncharacterized protein n=1 Tax=Oryza meyeriana var. granulata TaxID=110450 RepID=A0A6G1E9I8_9ORYZ|nr:hypothetical protein E2562_003131 [Oryza meyeriana var. granulata]